MTETKPCIPYGELRWYEAFERLKKLPQGTKLTGGGVVYELDYCLDEPHPASLWLKYRENGKQKTRPVRKGDVLILELQPK